MSRIFFVLSLLAWVLLGTNLVVGLTIGDFNRAARELVETNRELQRLRAAPLPDAHRLKETQGRLDEASRLLEPVYARKRAHVWIGIAAALFVLLVNAICVTYFVGTGRWCREVVETYQLDSQLIHDSNRVKRRTFPWALSSVLVLLGLVSLGAASDPAANYASSDKWVVAHYSAAFFSVLWIGWSFLVQVRRIDENYAIIQRILNRVREIRAQRGLDVV